MSNRLIIILSCFSLLLLVASCTTITADADVTSEPQPTSTTFIFFEEREDLSRSVISQAVDPGGVPTVASMFSERDTPTPRPSPTPLPTYPPLRPALTQGDVITVTLFDDQLNENWEFLERTGATIDTSSDIRVHAGRRSIAFTPEVDYSTLYFAVKPAATAAYPFQNVLGVNFWINGGDDFIQLDHLTLAVIGSNKYSYWVADDDSVKFPQGESFSETRLYYLGLNRSIPPETWVQVYLPLDTLIYDPEYDNVVGFYLKNDVGFRNTVYVDEVSLIMVEEPEETVPATPEIAAGSEAAPTAEPTTQGELVETPAPTMMATPESVECVVSPPAEWELHSIQAGESISGLAFEAGIYTDYALSVNCLEADDVVSVGQGIWLPALPSSEESEETPVPPGE